jgi:hypothetical protein
MTDSLTKAILLAGIALAAVLVAPRLIPGPTTTVSALATVRHARSTAVLRADAAGAVPSTAYLRAPAAGVPVTGQALGQQIPANATPAVSAVSYVPLISLVPYAARPGQSVEVQGHGFAPNEEVRLIVERASVARPHADTDGAVRLHDAYTVPYHARPGFVRFSVIGERSRQAAEQRLYIVPLGPWATASAYVVHPGDRVRFEVHGFAAHEAINVYEGTVYLGHSTRSTDTAGDVASVGPFTVSAGSQRPTFMFIGARSGARLRVSLTLLPR